MSTLKERLIEFDKLSYAKNVEPIYNYDNFAKKFINWKTWTLTGYNNSNEEICKVSKSETDNATKYIKFLNKLYDKNYKISNDSINYVRNHPDKFMNESLENMLSDSQKKNYFTQYCEIAYLNDHENNKIHFTLQDIIDMKTIEENYKSLFCERLGITIEYFNNKLNLY
tara:strand:- start:2065 stop:2571 length:507 start_codon:yes stop_codon:yes gene_type:complete